jgi:hypothetical protein
MASISWTATTSGTWSQASNWSLAAGPLTTDDVTISEAGSPLTVTYASGSVSIDSLTTGNGDTLNMAGGTLHVVNGYTLGGPLTQSGGSLVLNAGEFGGQVDGPVSLTGGTLSVYGGSLLQGNAFTQSAGNLLNINRGSLVDQEAFSTLAGKITGNGGLVLNSGTTTLASGLMLTTGAVTINAATVYLNENMAYAGRFTLSQSGTLNLGSSTLNLTGLGSLGGIVASSNLNLSGVGHFNGLTLENGTKLSLTGTYSQTGAINLGQTGSGTLSVASTGMLRLTSNSVITNNNLGGVLQNAGLVIKTGGSPNNGATNIYAAVNNTGTIDVAVGTLAFFAPSNGATSTLGGTLTGAGTVAFDTGNFAISSSSFKLATGRMVLANSASLTLTSTGLTYAGAFDQIGGTLVVGTPGVSGGSTLTLSGLASLDGGLLKGTGTILSSGAVHLGNTESLEGNLTFDFGGVTPNTVSQTGTIQLGNQTDAITTANIGSMEDWLLEGASSILGVNGTINNTGLFEKISGSGTSIVQNTFNNLANGIVDVNSGMLMLSGGGALGGSVTGAAALDISGNVSFLSGLSLTVGELILDNGQIALGGNLTYANDWSQEGGTLALAGDTLTLTGIASLEAGSIQGAGTVVVNGPAIIGQGPSLSQPISLIQGAQLILNGTTEQNGTLAMTGGSTSPTLTIGAGGTYALDPSACIGVPGSSVIGTVVVAGTLSALGAGVSTITAAVVDNNLIRVSNGDMSFMGPVSGTGSIVVGSGGTVELNATTPEHIGITFIAGGGVLSLAHPDVFGSTITGFASGDVIELQGFAFANITPVVSGDTVTLTEASGQSMTLHFNTAQSATHLTLGEGPHGGLALIHT